MTEVAPEFQEGVATAYSASMSSGAAALATDIFALTGSSSKVVTIKAIEFMGTRTTAGTVPVQLIKRSTANTGGGTASIVQFQSTTSAVSSTTIAITVTATGAGHLIVIGASNADNRTVSGITDGTTAFTQATNAAGAATAIRSDVWYLLSSNAGKTTFTATFSGASTTKELFFWEVSGTGAAFDVAAHITSGVVGATDTGAPVTAAGPSFIVGIVNTAGTITANPVSGNEFTTSGGINSFNHAGCSLLTGTLATVHTPAWSDSGAGAFTSSTAAFTISGSNPVTVTAVPHDSTNGAATATVTQYVTNPTVGTSVGVVRAAQIYLSTTTAPVSTLQRWTFTEGSDQGITLRGTSQQLCVSLGGNTVAGGAFNISVEWEESI